MDKTRFGSSYFLNTHGSAEESCRIKGIMLHNTIAHLYDINSKYFCPQKST